MGGNIEAGRTLWNPGDYFIGAVGKPFIKHEKEEVCNRNESGKTIERACEFVIF